MGVFSPTRPQPGLQPAVLLNNSRDKAMSNEGHHAPQAFRRCYSRTLLCLSLFFCAVAISLVAGCGKKEETRSETVSVTDNKEKLEPSHPALPTGAVALPAPFGRYTDDLDGMVRRRNIRALVMINPIGFFYSDGQPMGVDYEGLREFESFVNQKMRTGALKVSVTFIPMRPDQIEAALQQGVGDLVAYALVVTPERWQRVAFTHPLQTDVKQVIVAGPKSEQISGLDDLGGKQIYVNPLTANYQLLQQLNKRLQKEHKPTIVIKLADKNLMEDDLIQMVNAGLIPATVTSETRTKLWSQVLPHLTVRQDLMIAGGEQTAWAVRKNNPQLKQLLDGFIAPRAVGSSFGNTLLRRYLQNTKWVMNATSPEELKKFAALSALFKRYAGQYDFDYLMIMAQGYQESRLDQNERNPSGAVGIMQVIPKDAAASPIDIPNVSTAGNNILAGVKMLRNIEDHYFNDPQIDPEDKMLMAFASYNAGPNRIARLRSQAAQHGLDSNKWFDNVELMVAEDIGQETVTYVDNVYKYYIAYKLALEQKGLQDVAERRAK
jgi:membrane-bound lytic murein transglycosylase MltF